MQAYNYMMEYLNELERAERPFEELSYDEQQEYLEKERLAKIYTREDYTNMVVGKTKLYDEEGTEYVYLGLQNYTDHWPVFARRSDGFISGWYREKFIKGYKNE